MATDVTTFKVSVPKTSHPRPKQSPFLFYPSYANLNPNVKFHNHYRRTKFHDQMQELRPRRREAPTVPLHDPPATPLKPVMKLIGKKLLRGPSCILTQIITYAQTNTIASELLTSCPGKTCTAQTETTGTFAGSKRKVFNVGSRKHKLAIFTGDAPDMPYPHT